MFELVLANLRVRPFRTLISVIGVALGVVLIILFTGLAKGMTEDMAKRASNWKAEIVFTRHGAIETSSSNASVNVAYATKIKEFEGVADAIPVYRYLSSNTKGRWGIQQLDGVEWKAFSAMNEINIVNGRGPEADNEIILDARQLREDNVKIGDDYPLFGNKMFKVVGEFSPPSGARIKMQLSALQAATGATDRCTYVLVKVKNGFDPETVAQTINTQLPGNKVTLTKELIVDAQNRIPGLNTFLRVLVGLGAFVSTIFVLLSMYTTITERRKEIGILKSLGAPKSFIVSVIESEAFIIGVLGIIVGGVVSFGAAAFIERAYEIPFNFNASWIVTACVIAILGSLIGALYPSWQASNIDPVEVMLNE